MLITDLIKKLEDIKDKHGDIKVCGYEWDNPDDWDNTNQIPSDEDLSLVVDKDDNTKEKYLLIS